MNGYRGLYLLAACLTIAGTVGAFNNIDEDTIQQQLESLKEKDHLSSAARSLGSDSLDYDYLEESGKKLTKRSLKSDNKKSDGKSDSKTEVKTGVKSAGKTEIKSEGTKHLSSARGFSGSGAKAPSTLTGARSFIGEPETSLHVCYDRLLQNAFNISPVTFYQQRYATSGDLIATFDDQQILTIKTNDGYPGFLKCSTNFNFNIAPEFESKGYLVERVGYGLGGGLGVELFNVAELFGRNPYENKLHQSGKYRDEKKFASLTHIFSITELLSKVGADQYKIRSPVLNDYLNKLYATVFSAYTKHCGY